MPKLDMPELDIQIATDIAPLPSPDDLHTWFMAALPNNKHTSEMTIRIVDIDESQTLNATYRGKDKPTNVLSFPADLPDEVNIPLLGDLVICAQIVNNEASAQNKTINAHWAHMVIHGTLHLLGYDHENDDDAHTMESLEISLLDSLGFTNPYADNTYTDNNHIV